MNENIAEGALREMGGNVKKAVGDVANDRSLQAEGSADAAGGRAQKSLGHVQAAVEDTLAPAIDFAKRQPLAALGIAAAAGAALFAAFGRKPQ
ncbi:CsbD family protein [Sphingomonas sp.]|uniref:CsbD family protein n=1 Tax=Sphingomonas sp. TaxID=28214 RepID=UPI002CA4C4CF|nr:CsbD family protein [Sphingomonas sp.]HTG39827.1 CsbD family protein [Sphingomonas sp.]